MDETEPAPRLIRPFEAGDEARWRVLWQGYQDFYEVTLPRAATDTTWRRLLDPAEPMAGLAAIDDGRLAGIAHLVFHRTTWRTADTCYLQDLFVDPACRGRGIAHGLLNAVYAVADEAGATQVYWLTHETNITARRLYDRLGINAGFVLYERTSEARP